MPIENYAGVFITFMVIWVNTYYVYKAWFDPDSLRNSLIQQQRKLPNWYPLKNYALRKLQSPGWIYEIRFLTIVSSAFTIFFVGIMVVILAF